MKLFIGIAMKQIYLFNIVAWNYRKKIGFPVCKKKNFAGLQAHRKRGKSARASPTPHHTLNEERSTRFTAQPLSALLRRLVQKGHDFVPKLNGSVRSNRKSFEKTSPPFEVVLFPGRTGLNFGWMDRAPWCLTGYSLACSHVWLFGCI